MRRRSKIIGVLIGSLLILVSALVIRAATFETKQVVVEPTSLSAPPGAAERLAEAVRFRTVSNADPQKMDLAEFGRFNAFLETAFPRAHQVLQREVVEPCSLVYTWKGKSEKPPVLLASHTDVVPVESHEVGQWTHGPFSGELADGYVWGRGTLDDKVGVLGLLEAVELLAAKNHAPDRTLVFAFGCDEEVGGELGAGRIARLFASRKLEFEFALDEGLAVVEGYMPGVQAPVALVGLVEKGFATFELSVESEGGHSSMPPAESAIGILARGITRLEQHQMPARLSPAAEQMFDHVGPEMPFAMRLLFANLWLLEPVLLSQLQKQKSTNASIRTTTAVTMMNAGVQDNVLAKKAVATVNFRLLPGDTIEAVRRHIVETVDDERISVKMVEGGFGNEASKISSADTEGFRHIRDAVRATFGNEVIVAPGSTTGGTDVRHYEDLSNAQYRFAPVHLRKSENDTARIHGIDERIGVENYQKVVVFYAEFLQRL